MYIDTALYSAFVLRISSLFYLATKMQNDCKYAYIISPQLYVWPPYSSSI